MASQAKKKPAKRIKGPIHVTDERVTVAGPTNARAELIIPLDFPDPPGSRPTDTLAQRRGRLLAYLERIRRGEKMRCYVVPLDGKSQPRVEWHPWPSVSAVRPQRRTRGRPRLDPADIDRLREDIENHKSRSMRQRAEQLRIPLTTIRRYLPRLLRP